MTVGDISSHLLADWVPSLPAAIGSSFIGWPPFLFELTKHRNNDVLAIRPEVGRSERQWKSVLSWMVGVAGARHILASEGYRWIAPLSAFYPEAVIAFGPTISPCGQPRRRKQWVSTNGLWQRRKVPEDV